MNAQEWCTGMSAEDIRGGGITIVRLQAELAAERELKEGFEQAAIDLVNRLQDEGMLLGKAEAERDGLQRLVAIYQGEGSAELPEEDEYRAPADIPRKRRTEVQRERLIELARFLNREMDTKILRAERDEFKTDGLKLMAQLAEAKNLLADALDHSDLDAAAHEINQLRGELANTWERCKTCPEVPSLEAKIAEVTEEMQKAIGQCCGDKADDQFCDSYGCGALKRWIAILED